MATKQSVEEWIAQGNQIKRGNGPLQQPVQAGTNYWIFARTDGPLLAARRTRFAVAFKAIGVSQKELARRLHISRGKMSWYVNGKGLIPMGVLRAIEQMAQEQSS